MAIGDDGIASVCMGKAHIGNPCENCGHENEVEEVETLTAELETKS